MRTSLDRSVPDAMAASGEGDPLAASLSEILKNLAEGVFMVGAEDGRIKYANERFERMFGYGRGEMAGKDVADLHPPGAEAPRRAKAEIRRALERAGCWSGEVECVRKDGSRFWAFASITVTEHPTFGRVHISVHNDIDERKRIEAELRRSEERYRTLFDRAADGIMLMSLDGRSVIVNESFARMHGYADPGEMEGMRLEDLDAPESSRLAPERLRSLKAGEALSFEVEHRHRDGHIFPLSVSCSVISIGGQRYFLGFHRDLTERKRMERSLQTLQEQRLESLGTLAGGIAHDFNNMLTGIVANLSLLRVRGRPGALDLSLLHEAEEACQAARGLARQLLTFATGGKPLVETRDLGTAVRRAVQFAARGSKARCVVSAPGGPFFARVDEGQLAQVMQNLVLNAVQAMAGGGSISVRIRRVKVAEKEVGPLAAGRYVRISVQDSGPGIPAEQLPRVFDPYFSTKGAGRGMGLSVCHSIIAKHDGHIAAGSKPGGGACFTIHLPAAPRPKNARPKRPAARPSLEGARILVMDDDRMVSRTLTRALRELGCSVTEVRRGEDALREWRKGLGSREPFAAAIMDLTIPGGMGGAEALSRIRAFDPGVKAIVSSGYSTDPIMSDYREHGFAGVLAKPFRIEDLQEVLGRVL